MSNLDIIRIPFDLFYNTKSEINPDSKIKERFDIIERQYSSDSVKSYNKYNNNSKYNNGSNNKTKYNNAKTKLLPAHLIEFNSNKKCPIRQLTGLINKINNSNQATIKTQILNIFRNVIETENILILDQIVTMLINKTYIARQYTPFLISVLKELSSVNNDILEKIQTYHENNIDLLDSKIEDILYLSTSNKYNDFCDCNKKKQNLLNWGQTTLILINENMIDFTYECYFDLIFFKVCECFSSNCLINTEILVDLLAEFVVFCKKENCNGIDDLKYRRTISKFYNNNIKQKLNKMCQFKFEQVI